MFGRKKFQDGRAFGPVLKKIGVINFFSSSPIYIRNLLIYFSGAMGKCFLGVSTEKLMCLWSKEAGMHLKLTTELSNIRVIDLILVFYVIKYKRLAGGGGWG